MTFINKEDFITEVMGTIPIERLQHYSAVSSASDERLKCMLLEVKLWANQQGGVLFWYRHAAEWIKMAYDDNLINDDTKATLRAMNTEQVLALVWDVKEHAQLPEQASAYLRSRFAA